MHACICICICMHTPKAINKKVPFLGLSQEFLICPGPILGSISYFLLISWAGFWDAYSSTSGCSGVPCSWSVQPAVSFLLGQSRPKQILPDQPPLAANMLFIHVSWFLPLEESNPYMLFRVPANMQGFYTRVFLWIDEPWPNISYFLVVKSGHGPRSAQMWKSTTSSSKENSSFFQGSEFRFSGWLDGVWMNAQLGPAIDCSLVYRNMCDK